MVQDDVEVVVRELFCDGSDKLAMEGLVIVDGVVGNDVKGDGMCLGEIEKSMRLQDVRILPYEAQYAILKDRQITGGAKRIDAHGGDDVVLVIEFLDDAAREQWMLRAVMVSGTLTCSGPMMALGP